MAVWGRAGPQGASKDAQARSDAKKMTITIIIIIINGAWKSNLQEMGVRVTRVP